jgi:hypothetical protein
MERSPDLNRPAGGSMKKTFSGAQYLRNHPEAGLVDRDGTENKHWVGIHSKSTGMTCDPTYRDIGHCLAFLMKESLTAATEICYPEDAEGREALDTIGQFIAKIWNESLHDNLNGLCQFRSLYKRLEEIPKGQEAYTYWTHYFVQTYICYLFTVSKMANGLREGWLEDAAEYNAMLTVINSLDDDLKSQVIIQLREKGVWPSNISYSKLIRRLDDFVNVVIEGQHLRLNIPVETEEDRIKRKVKVIRLDTKIENIKRVNLDLSDVGNIPVETEEDRIKRLNSETFEGEDNGEG